MDEHGKATPWSHRVLKELRQAITADAHFGLPALTYRVPVEAPDGRRPLIFTVDLAPHGRGTFLVTCREVDQVVLLAEDEEEALSDAMQAIKELLASRSSSDFPS